MSDDLEQLQHLLDELNSVDDTPKVQHVEKVIIEEPIKEVVIEQVEIITEQVEKFEPSFILEPVDPHKPDAVRDLSKNAELIVESTAHEPEAPIFNLREQVDQLNSITEEIIIGTRSDRQETQSVIDLIRNEIDKAITGSREPARMYLDNLVNALGVKSEINMTAVKALETKAKFLAATKAGVVVNTQNNVVHNNDGKFNNELSAILDKNPLSSDDEY